MGGVIGEILPLAVGVAISPVPIIAAVLGVLLLSISVRQGRARGGPSSTTTWMTAIDTLAAVKAVGLGFALAAVNPKNLLLAAAAGVTIGAVELGVGGPSGPSRCSP